MSASERRILMTRWMGDAVEAYNSSDQYKRGLFRMFEKTGALMTADGTNDSAIMPQGADSSFMFERLDAREEANPDEDASVAGEDTDVSSLGDESDDDDDDDDDAIHVPVGAAGLEAGGDVPGVAAPKLITFAEMVKSVTREPSQLRLISGLPELDKTLLGKRVAVVIPDVGWCAGKVETQSSSAKYNYRLLFDAQDTRGVMLSADTFVGGEAPGTDWTTLSLDASPPGSWCVFGISILPARGMRPAPERAALPPQVVAAALARATVSRRRSRRHRRRRRIGRGRQSSTLRIMPGCSPLPRHRRLLR